MHLPDRLTALLFPHTEFEVRHEGYQYHIFSEGEWQACHDTVEETLQDVAERLDRDNVIRCYPNWAKWPLVNVWSPHLEDAVAQALKHTRT